MYRDDGEQCSNTKTAAAKSANDVPERSDDQKGKIPKEGIRKEKRERKRESNSRGGEGGEADIIYSTQTEGGGWAPVSKKKERGYDGYRNSWGKNWQWAVGTWIEMRDPTDSDIDEIDPSPKKMSPGEYANMTYAAVLGDHPVYVSYLKQETKPRHLAGKKFPPSG